jgi:hypothetical protein
MRVLIENDNGEIVKIEKITKCGNCPFLSGWDPSMHCYSCRYLQMIMICDAVENKTRDKHCPFLANPKKE